MASASRASTSISTSISTSVSSPVSSPILTRLKKPSKPPQIRVQSPAPPGTARCDQPAYLGKQCEAKARWKIDGMLYCLRHQDDFWMNHFVDEHEVVRLCTGEDF
jgi:hypothetical protein